MLFIHTLDKVLSGEKSQTRRIVKPEHHALNVWRGELGEDLRIGMTGDANRIGVIQSSGRDMWRVCSDYAVQPGRGKPAVARIRITSIRCEDVRGISETDVKAEGFTDHEDFWIVWTYLHDKPFYGRWVNRESRVGLMDRSAERYQAWVIEFELVK